jgi:polar amino acid transport system substrate-binding protein
MEAASASKVHGWCRWTMRSTLAGVLTVAAVSLGACTARRGAQSTAPPPPPPELRVGIAPNYPPLAFKQNGALAGVEVDFAHQLGPALGMHVTLVQTPWEDLIPALRENRIDIIMSGMSITEQRRQLVSFAHPYLRVGQMILLRRTDARRLRANRAINQPTIRVGFVSGTTGDTYVREHLSRAQPREFDSVEAGVAALRAHQIDIFVHDAPSIYRITAPPERELVGRFEPLTEEYLAWAVRKDDSALRARLDTVLSQWNGNGTLDSTLGKWIKVRRKPRRAK